MWDIVVRTMRSARAPLPASAPPPESPPPPAPPTRATCAISCIIVMSGGNFGACPNPPVRESKPPSSISTAAVSSSVPGTSAAAPAGRLAATFSCTLASASVRWEAIPSTRSRSVRQVSDTAESTCRKAGCPGRGRGGKYVPVKKGRPSWSTMTVIGQPPAPRIACSASM